MKNMKIKTVTAQVLQNQFTRLWHVVFYELLPENSEEPDPLTADPGYETEQEAKEYLKRLATDFRMERRN
ncbi:MAG: hypothetical protein IPJ03_16620 [Ignavibacteriales bacterium]|nr:hypothetical protein [Ignavibacteriales bacterium]